MSDLNHLFISDDGNLFDTRDDQWTKHPLRRNYRRNHRLIKNVADLKTALRAGPYAWPGGYPMYFITSNDGALSFETARKELRNVIDSIVNQSNDGWRVVGCDINYEDGELVDDHTGERIESAYAD